LPEALGIGRELLQISPSSPPRSVYGAEPGEAMLDVGGIADFTHFAIVDDINPRYDLLANRCPDC
jgi:hypothetical protein